MVSHSILVPTKLKRVVRKLPSLIPWTRGLYIYACSSGASVTDITILIVALRMTVLCHKRLEAINHSKAAGVPIIVAINKIDKPDTTQNDVIGELAEHGVISTAWGW